MDNPRRPDNDDEEYYFPESDEQEKGKTPFLSPNSHGAAQFFEKIERKHIFIAVSALVGLFVLYQLINFFIPSKDELSRKPAPAVVQAPKEVAPAPKVQVSLGEEKITALESQLSDLNKKLDQEQEAVTRIENAFNNVQSQMVTINSALQQISQQLTQQHAQAVQRTKKKKSPALSLAARSSKYFIKALIPGRAWLQGSEGSTITVGVGDKVPDDGMVVNIDAMSGMVTTDTGAVIRFHPSDR